MVANMTQIKYGTTINADVSARIQKRVQNGLYLES